MVNGDLLRQLFRGHSKRDDVTFRAAAEAIIQEERAKKTDCLRTISKESS
jgi:hypothetical protein